MDLSSGAREFHDIDDEEEKELEYMFKEMNWKQKLLYRIKNW
jgi:amino acid transporter